MCSNKTEQPKFCYFRKIILGHQEWPLRQCLVEYSDIPITIQRGRKLGYALPVKTKIEMIENFIKFEVPYSPNHKDKICIVNKLKQIKIS